MAQVGDFIDLVSIDDAQSLGEYCDANLIIWGDYSKNHEPTIHLTLRYHFLDNPEWSNLGKLITLKDIAFIQKGEMTKDLEDSIMSLCALIAIRQGNTEIALEWLDKTKEKDAMDIQLIDLLN